MITQGKAIYLVLVLVFAAAVLSFRPGVWLVHKPASRQSESYAKGWEDGCTSGTNSYSLLYAPLLDQPFVKDLDLASPAPSAERKNGTDTAGTTRQDHYKTGWNEGFTMCRFFQASVYELMQFGILIATLLFIGYLLARRKSV